MAKKIIFHIGGEDKRAIFPSATTFGYRWIEPSYNPITDVDGYDFFAKGNNNQHLFILDKDAHFFTLPEVVEKLPAHQIFAHKELGFGDEAAKMLMLKNGKIVGMDNYEWLFDFLIGSFDYRPYGMIIHTNQMEINDRFQGYITKYGNVYMELEGDFGSEFSQVLSFKDAQYYRNMVEFYPEVKVDSEELEIIFRLYFTSLETGEFVGSTDVTIERIRQGAVYIDLGKGNEYVSIGVLARGKGILRLGNIHLGFAPKDGSVSQVGGRKLIDKDDMNGAIFHYFNPGDMKPPLAVYFSGYRPAEGFEGRFMMGNFGCPFMLIHDPRLEGGAFYMGSRSFEQEVAELIKEKMKLLGFNKSQLILSGLSMGTYGALYYGSKLEPGYIIVGKPLVHLGDIMVNERINRRGGFPTSYDVQLQHQHDLSLKSAQEFNERFWKVFRKADFTNTHFIFAYMKQDDYDPLAFPKCFQYLRGYYPFTKIMYKGFEGRHTDPSTANEWFIKQYGNVLEENFGRVVIEDS